MMAFRGKGRRYYDTKVPTEKGVWVKRPTGTFDPQRAKLIDRMIEVLGTGKGAWDVLSLVTDRPYSMTLAELYSRWMAAPVTRWDKKTGKPIEPSSDERLTHLRESLDSVNLEPLIKSWREALVGPAIHVSADTADHYVSAVRTLIDEGEVFAREDLSEQAIRVWLEEMDDVVPSTARKRAIGLHQFIHWLKGRGLLTHDPMREITLPESGDPLCHYLELDEVTLLSDKSAGQMKEFELVLPGTGMEVSVALQARVRDVSKAEEEIRAAGTKAYTRDRVVRVAGFAWPAVLELTRRKHPDTRLFDEIPHRFFARDAHTEIRKALVEDKHRCFAFMSGNLPHDYTLRDHRHTWAVRHARAGVPLEAIARQLGHRDTVLASKVYGKFVPSKGERERYEKMAALADTERAKERPSQ